MSASSCLPFAIVAWIVWPLAAKGEVTAIDLADETNRQVVVDREPGQYLGHPTTVLLEDGKTVLCVYPKGHGRGAIVMKKSIDGGRTWSERLPVPASWATSKETPTIHRVVDAAGRKRLIVWSGLHPARLAVSEDDGATWSELAPAGDWGGIVVMSSVVPLRTGPDGKHAGEYLALFHDDGRFFAADAKPERPVRFTLYATRSADGGLTWSAPVAIQSSADVHLCEPGVIRSPDGTRLAVLLRENARRKNSHVMFSSDEGRTWSEPRELPAALTGDRHVGAYAPDGRLFISFRDTARGSPTAGDWVAWVGTWDDIEQGRDGQYRVRLMDNTKGSDCAYPGVDVLPDGTILTTTYGHWTAGEEPYIVSVRLSLAELDAGARQPRDATPAPRPAAGAGGAARTGPRNVVVIMADDLGWGDVSCNGATAVATPAIDRLAREGRRFTSGYASASTCTPTRYSFLTGEYAFRRAGTGIAPPNAAAIIPPGTPTIASVLKSAGRATAIVGKWHLGLGQPGKGPDWNGVLAPGPLDLGFDHCFILPTTNDRVPPVFVEGRRVKDLDPADPLWVGDAKPSADHPTGIDRRDTLTMDWSHGHNQSVHNGIGRIGFVTGGERARFRDEELADAWVRESVRWIEDHKDAPFFLFLASHDLHVPRVAPERFQGRSPLGPRGDCILSFDWCVGEVTAALERLGLAKDTLVIVCSDNGPVLDDGYKDGAVEKLGDHTPAGPFRGGKGGVFEGGTRTPFIAWWPGRIEPAVSDETVCTIDLGRSLATLMGATVPAGAFPDAVDVSGALVGTVGAKGRTALVEQDNGSGRLGYRAGRWKLVRIPPRKGPGPQRGYGVDGARPGDALYDLDADPGETTDVATRHPDVAARLGADLDRIVGGAGDRPRPATPSGPVAPTQRPATPAPPAAATPPAAGPIRVLFIGNSYTHANDLPGMLKKLSAAGRRRRVITGMEAPGGCTFEQHVRDGRAVTTIGSDAWDFVVLQEQSMLPIVDPARTLAWGPKLDAAADARGATTLLYQTWARAGRPETQSALTATYAELARRCGGAKVVPVGEA